MAFDDDWEAVSPTPGKKVTKTEVIRLLGDAVTPPVADWLTTQTLASAT